MNKIHLQWYMSWEHHFCRHNFSWQAVCQTYLKSTNSVVLQAYLESIHVAVCQTFWEQFFFQQFGLSWQTVCLAIWEHPCCFLSNILKPPLLPPQFGFSMRAVYQTSWEHSSANTVCFDKQPVKKHFVYGYINNEELLCCRLVSQNRLVFTKSGHSRQIYFCTYIY